MSGRPEDLCIALTKGEHTTVNDLIESHGGFTKVVNEIPGLTNVHLAASGGNIPVLQTIWKKWKPPIGQKDKDGATALHWGNMGCRVSKGGMQN